MTLDELNELITNARANGINGNTRIFAVNEYDELQEVKSGSLEISAEAFAEGYSGDIEKIDTCKEPVFIRLDI